MSDLRLPAWAEELKNRYLSGESSMFVIHGNVRDLVPWSDGEPTGWVGLRPFLEKFLGRTRDVVAYYNVSEGLCFPDRVQQTFFRTAVNASRTAKGVSALSTLPREIGPTLRVVEELITDPMHASAFVLDFAEMVVPNASVAFMSEDDKSNLVTMQRWSSDPAFMATDNLVILITEHLSDLSRRVLASPRLATINIPFPDESSRLAFLTASQEPGLELAMPLPSLAKMTAGLTLTQARSILQMAIQTSTPVTFEAISKRKKVLIEQECHGLVEFVAPKHDLSYVGGMDEVKADLRRVAQSVQAGLVQQVPMGMIFVGPMGTGKTFVAEAFAAESGLTCLKFKNFRDRWVGSTEANLEKVLDLVKALGYVLLIIDEAERALAGGDSDGGTGSRVIARLKEFMSDTSRRGRVVMLMMTNRPDKLDTDLKRPGRFDLKIPFFPPEKAEDRLLILKALVRKNKIELAGEEGLQAVAEVTEKYSGAELEAVLIEAAGLAARDGRTSVTDDDLAQASADVVPSRDVRMLAYMEMLAVFECSARRMLPVRYQDLETDEVLEKLDRLRLQLGSRA